MFSVLRETKETRTETQIVHTDKDDMEIQLAFVFALPVHLGHLFERLKHGLDNPLVSGVHRGSYLQGIGTDELAFDKADIDGEVFHEVNHPFALFARKFRLLHAFNLLVLKSIRNTAVGLLKHNSQYDDRRALSSASAASPRH
jgi:hypothetical protein